MSAATTLQTAMKTLHGLIVAILALALVPSLYSAKKPPGPIPPAAPSNLRATLIATDQVLVTWQDNSTDELQFRIERSTDAFLTVVVIATGANVTQYTDKGLPPGTAFAYRIRAASKTASSAYSNVATVTTPNPTPPPAAPSGPKPGGKKPCPGRAFSLLCAYTGRSRAQRLSALCGLPLSTKVYT
jgi:hypothetical protein